MTRDEIHPEVLKAMDAVHLPEVQDMMQRLAKHGLAIAVPHMHGDKGDFLPLPNDKVAFEASLKVSFREQDEPAVMAGIPVMWRWDSEMKTVAACSKCSAVSYRTYAVGVRLVSSCGRSAGIG